MAEPEVRELLKYLGWGEEGFDEHSNQALSALLFLYGVVLEPPLGVLQDVVRARMGLDAGIAGQTAFDGCKVRNTERRHHAHETAVQGAVKAASRLAQIRTSRGAHPEPIRSPRKAT